MENQEPRITVLRKETRQVRDYENNTYSVSISVSVDSIDKEDIMGLQNLVKETIEMQKKKDGIE